MEFSKNIKSLQFPMVQGSLNQKSANMAAYSNFPLFWESKQVRGHQQMSLQDLRIKRAIYDISDEVNPPLLLSSFIFDLIPFILRSSLRWKLNVIRMAECNKIRNRTGEIHYHGSYFPTYCQKWTFYYSHCFSWGKKHTKMIGHMPWLYQQSAVPLKINRNFWKITPLWPCHGGSEMKCSYFHCFSWGKKHSKMIGHRPWLYQ